ncbi:UNVERIFIED_CONTAM: hypothetical protein Sangu_2105900 [Sesamum angustifolium]|uniref:Secreted protein n=1 Tax=Sesamum angustifolium TaxID=2727405 RepID=A0AAW2LM05_9LAMI
MLELFGVRSYLFWVGFDLLGGTLLKLDFSFLYGLCSFTCKPLKDCEDGTIFVAGVRTFARRSRVACAPCMSHCKTSTNARSKEAITLRWDFITDCSMRTQFVY